MISIIIAFFGFLNAGYLTLLSITNSNTCIAGQSCIDVISSDYGSLVGIPLAYIGLCFFSLLIYLRFKSLRGVNEGLGTELILSGAGSIASLWFMYIQLFILSSFCLFCSLSAGLVISFFVLTLLQWRSEKRSFSSKSFHLCKIMTRDLLIIIAVFASLHVIPKTLLNHYSITINPKTAVSSSYKSWSTAELDKLIGVRYAITQSNLYNHRRDAVINELITHDASQLKLDLGQYYSLFVRRSFSFDHSDTRNHIQSLNGSSQRIQQLLASKAELEPSEMRDRYNALQSDILEFYKTDFHLKKDFKLDVQDNPIASLRIGPANAPVQVTVFSDFLCSHCASFHTEIEPLIEAYPRDLSVQFRHFSHQGPLSRKLSKSSICAHQQQQFLPVAHSIFKHQKELIDKKTDSILDLPSSINKAFWNTCMSSTFPASVLREDDKEVERLGLRGTPTVIVNGYYGDIQLIRSELQQRTRNTP